jgi:hypothetical protein
MAFDSEGAKPWEILLPGGIPNVLVAELVFQHWGFKTLRNIVTRWNSECFS